MLDNILFRIFFTKCYNRYTYT